MANDSSTGGFLTQIDSHPLFDDEEALQNFFQTWFVGLTGIDGTLVRPRWQTEPPNLPEADENWLAFGIHDTTPQTFAAELHYPANNGYNEVRRHEEMKILISAYGPNARPLLTKLSIGVQVSQNREILSLNDMGLIATGSLIPLGEFIKQRWYRRVDMPLWIRRQDKRRYGIKNLLSAQGELNNEDYIEPINVIDRSTP